MDDSFQYDAVIEVVSKHIIRQKGKTPYEELNFTLAEVGMGYCATVGDGKLSTETNFRQRVFAVEKSLKKAYEFWPDGDVSVNTKFITGYVNG